MAMIFQFDWSGKKRYGTMTGPTVQGAGYTGFLCTYTFSSVLILFYFQLLMYTSRQFFLSVFMVISVDISVVCYVFLANTIKWHLLRTPSKQR